ncbi:MAG: type II toxin-antitoxin system VapC family toxin [Thiothrix sp.]|uniref:type II toxin-antitoxin system VapC family toxin n=1 Tax=Thiothrix sp. TaxID=1032 RepID=UPI0026169DDC|nr:type II toxin-antitoxin system VapC family toxin [Thiothrix sp.]MDD5393975.1 type II toxin-antitoxin system VapC family toxin [Thiothrix sp.]
MSKIVLDASAILAYLLDETGAEAVAPILEAGEGIVSSVNYAEVVSKLTDYQMPLAAIQMALDDLDLDIITFDVQQAVVTGELRAVSKPFGLSLGDRACLALSYVLQLPVLTADHNWTLVPGSGDVRVIR